MLLEFLDKHLNLFIHFFLTSFCNLQLLSQIGSVEIELLVDLGRRRVLDKWHTLHRGPQILSLCFFVGSPNEIVDGLRRSLNGSVVGRQGILVAS